MSSNRSKSSPRSPPTPSNPLASRQRRFLLWFLLLSATTSSINPLGTAGTLASTRSAMRARRTPMGVRCARLRVRGERFPHTVDVSKRRKGYHRFPGNALLLHDLPMVIESIGHLVGARCTNHAWGTVCVRVRVSTLPAVKLTAMISMHYV